jgi:glycerol-3-phosphate cytidylyltransferase
MRGFIAGAFDLLHPGHLYTFAMCKRKCDELVVGLQVNPQFERPEKNKPIQTVFERYMQLASCKYVNNIVPYETEKDLVNMLTTLNIDVRFLGEEYRDNPDKITVIDLVKIEYIPRDHSYSSTELRSRL